MSRIFDSKLDFVLPKQFLDTEKEMSNNAETVNIGQCDVNRVFLGQRYSI